MFTKKKGLNRKSGPSVHDDLVARRFTAQKPNQLWLTDITEHQTACIPAIVATLVVTRLPVKHSGALQGCPSRVISGVDR